MSWTAYLVCSVLAVVNTGAHRQLADLCRRSLLGLRGSPPTSHPRSHVPQSLRPTQQPREGREWLVDGAEHPSQVPWDAAPGNAAVCLGSAPRLVTQTSGYVALGRGSSFQASLSHTPVTQGSAVFHTRFPLTPHSASLMEHQRLESLTPSICNNSYS